MGIVFQRHEKDLAFYAPRHDVRTMLLSAWQADGWRDFPARRIDMEGEPEQPLTVQWAGPSDELARFLMSNGWQRPPSLSLKSFFGMFASETPVAELPVLPRLHDGRAERLRLVHTDQDKRLVLRLWPADVTISGDDTPFFIGTVEEQDRHQLAGLVITARDTGEYERPLNVLEQVLGGRFAVGMVQRTDPENRADRAHRRLRWRGKVLLSGSCFPL